MPPFSRERKRKGSTAELASEDWSSFKLRLTQVRVLKALLGETEDDTPHLSRVKLAERAGFSPISGTINSSLNGVPRGSSSGPARPGLLMLGYVNKSELDIDGLVETVYSISQKGRKALAKHEQAQGLLPKMRSKEASTNLRYAKGIQREEG